MPNTDPEETIELLDELEPLQFGNNAFERLHQFWQLSETADLRVGSQSRSASDWRYSDFGLYLVA
jgi:hypothetical protein